MRAIRVREFGNPEVMVEEEVPDLEPGEGQIVVAIRAAGVNPVDTYIRSGQYARKPELPYTPGMDGAGTVKAMGPGVNGVKPGDRVYVAGSVSGTYAEQALCLASQVHPLPDPVSFEQGAAIGVPYGVAYRALFQRAGVKPAETVLVHGATGGAGTAAVQLARAAGLKIIGTAGTSKGLDFIRAQGAEHAINHSDPDHWDQVMEITNGAGVDVVLEMLANVNLAQDLKIVGREGRIVVIGSRGTVEIDPRDAMVKEATILGVLLFNASETELATIHRALGERLAAGKLCPEIGQTFPLKDASLAHEAVLQSHAFGKIALIPS